MAPERFASEAAFRGHFLAAVFRGDLPYLVGNKTRKRGCLWFVSDSFRLWPES